MTPLIDMSISYIWIQVLIFWRQLTFRQAVSSNKNKIEKSYLKNDKIFTEKMKNEWNYWRILTSAQIYIL